jgi:hypothetical protein
MTRRLMKGVIAGTWTEGLTKRTTTIIKSQEMPGRESNFGLNL